MQHYPVHALNPFFVKDTFIRDNHVFPLLEMSRQTLLQVKNFNESFSNSKKQKIHPIAEYQWPHKKDLCPPKKKIYPIEEEITVVLISDSNYVKRPPAFYRQVLSTGDNYLK